MRRARRRCGAHAHRRAVARCSSRQAASTPLTPHRSIARIIARPAPAERAALVPFIDALLRLGDGNVLRHAAARGEPAPAPAQPEHA
jgi:hypothetical protein